jgi:hypothetical protein
MTWYIIFIAYWLVLFGFLKTIVASSSLLIPQTRPYYEKIPIANIFVNNDTSFAGFYSEVSLIIFGLYSLVHGAAILHWFPPMINALFETQISLIYFYTLFAIAFIGFYSLVLFTSLPISQDPKYMGNYWLNIAAGIFFLVVINIVFIWHELFNPNLSYIYLGCLILLFILLSYLILRIVHYAYTLENKPQPDDIIAYVTIPLNLA